MGTEFKLTASVPVALEDYGSAVAVSGDYAIVGARDGGFGPGSAYVYVMRGSGWTQQAKLNASDPKGLGHFGAAVSIDGDYAVIGAPDNGSHSEGRAYIFHRSGTSWNEQARLVASDMTRFGAFGRSVSMSDDAAIVGADRAAYVFRRAGSTWTEEAKLAAPPPVTNAGNFGVSVSISGDHAIVGDALGGAVAPNQGAAYVFRRAGASWDFQTPLTAVDGGPYDYFGWSVSISGDAAIVGAHDATSGGVSKAGGAYVFERSGSTWLPRWSPSDPTL